MGDEIIQIDDKHDKHDIDNEIVSHNPRDPHNAHNGKEISHVSLSPNGKYIVTYSKDDKSFEGWIVKDSKLILDPQTNIYKSKEYLIYLHAITVNDKKIVCYTGYTNDFIMHVFQMSNGHRQIKLNPPSQNLFYPPIYFKKSGNLVIFDENNNSISVYSTHDKMNDELVLMSFYKLSNYVKEVIIDENNNIWATSSSCLFHFDLETLQLKFSYSLGFAEPYINGTMTVISKENSIVVKQLDNIAIFSKGSSYFPIRNIQIEGYNIKVELLSCEMQNNDYLLVFDIPISNKNQNINLYCITDINKQPVDASMIFNENESKNKFILYEYNTESKEAFGLVDGKFSYKKLDLNWHEFFESHSEEDDYVCWNNYLGQTFEVDCYNNDNDTYLFPDMENIRSLFSKEHKNITEINFNNNQTYKWKIDPEKGKFSVYTDEEKEMDSSDGFKRRDLKRWKILNNNTLAILYYKRVVILEYDHNDKEIKCLYNFLKDKGSLNIKDFSGPILPIGKCPSKSLLKNILKDNIYLEKYGPTLLPCLIKSSESYFTCEIDPIYNKITKLVKENPERNLKFLSIITLSMDDLYEKYSDYVTKFNSEMFMVLDPSNNSIENYGHSHFSTFSKEIDITKINYSKIFRFFQYLFSLFSNAFRHLIGSKAIQYITLVVPYMNFSCYPLEYSWWKELFYPRPNVFVNTCKKEFYTNWNGEAIINFKWKTFGRIYYFIIWLLFMIFLVCFIIASYPTNSLNEEIQIKLYKTSVAFGFYHLIFELRQFIWNPKKYFLSIWNLFDLSAYLSVTIASIYWIKYINIPYWALSLSCLLLNLKFLLFFRIFESFGVYFAIIFGVAKRVFSFLVVLAIIIASFAYSFFLLLHPQNLLDSLNAPNPNDPNNPWSLSNTYNQVDENGNILNETLIQVPSTNTNLFYSYPTSLLATYLFLTGNQNSISPWSPGSSPENTTLFILLVVFSFLVVIYLMNLFIGLLNMAIEKDNDRASFLTQKAEVIAEIEIFYLLPHQRRWKSWFPEVIYYTVEVEKARIYIKEAINKGEWNMKDWPEMKQKILKRLNIEDAIKNFNN
ncbi:hypothetical protein RclHR1_02420001 [Rhizophagus clarus]|uniref:Ion transport domain-containing protein n=1 Tax=Rhizophagus clarus TaxID=94130 RepID=A0A2Z6RAC7_9GLOM|nr:hypothetical protein RclHR1_02420001 [Rhizophagus clarus]GES77172.1 hypothetical protein GLOIN_2v1781806 [Rhizophagus clarus]